jgi:tRNA (Uracil-5-)-methyltransferase
MDEATEIIYIGDDPFKISYMEYDVNRYEEFLKTKIDKVLAVLPTSITTQISKVDVIKSPVRHFRQRCRFAVMPRSISSNGYDVSRIDPIGVINSTDNESILHQSSCRMAGIEYSKDAHTIIRNTKSTAELDLNSRGDSNPLPNQGAVQLTYSLWENGGPNVNVLSFPIASISIYNAMPILLAYVETVSELHTDLRAINFLSTLSGELIATLVYGNELNGIWEDKAIEMQSKLGATDDYSLYFWSIFFITVTLIPS